MSLVLAVDDSPPLLALLTTCLKSGGHEVVPAGNGGEALDQLRRFRPDLVVTDLNMPVMSGLEFIAAARELPEGQGVPIFLLTSETSLPLLRRARAVHSTGWLPKPLNASRLLKLVDEMVEGAACGGR